MKRLNMDKLKAIMQDWEENGINFIDQDQMEHLYKKYGDEVFYDREQQCMACVRAGAKYIKLNDLGR